MTTDTVKQTWSNDGAEGLQLTLSDDTDNMILENDMQQAACQSICKDMMFMGQCDADEAGPGELIMTATERCPVVLVYREDDQDLLEPAPPTPTKKVTSSSRKRLFGRKSSSSQTSQSTPTRQRDPESVDIVYVEQDKQFSNECAIEVCSSPSNQVDDLCNRQGWPRS